MDTTFPGSDKLLGPLRRGSETFLLRGSDIKSRGEALGIPLGTID